MSIAAAVVLLAVARLTAQAAPPAPAFADKLATATSPLALQDGAFSGPGAATLRSALAGAHFVALGEDHGMQQVPAFTAALCRELAPQGFHTMAIETGPLAAQALQPMLNAQNGLEQVRAFDRTFPESLAFYNWQQEFTALSTCARAFGPGFTLWGLDQELMGASGLIFTRILDQHPGPAATAEVTRLRQKNDDLRAAAAKTGNPMELFMMAASDAELAHLRQLLQQDRNPRSLALLDSLLESRQIYQKNFSDSPASNRQRALLMKSNFIARYRAATPARGAEPRVLFKFGGEHLWKGYNPLRNLDLGTTLTELADLDRRQSLHILMLGARGTQLRFAGIGRPFAPAPFDLGKDEDSDFLFLQPIFAHLAPSPGASTVLTLVDLRALRASLKRKQIPSPEFERLLYGYDLLVIAPDATASTPLP